MPKASEYAAGSATALAVAGLVALGLGGVLVKPSGDTTGAADTAAFQAAAAAINAADGGFVHLVAGATYTVGQQTLAGSTGLGYSYQAASILKILNCAKPVNVFGWGAKIKAANGLKFGSFNPTTGASHDGGNSFTNYDYRADAYVGMIEASGNGFVGVYDMELDGNQANLSLGGNWNGPDRQCWACGINAYGNARLEVVNVYTHHHGLDGIIVGYDSLTEASPKTPTTLRGVISEYNARQGLSWVGGKGLTAIDSKFNHTGKGTFSASPGAGVDIEAESSVCRDGLFINCEMLNNTGVGVVGESGDNARMLFQRCSIIGTTNYSIWPNMPGFRFEDCTIAGTITNCYPNTGGVGATKFAHCHFTDSTSYYGTVYIAATATGLLSIASSDGTEFQDCVFEATRSAIGECRNTIHRRSKFKQKAGTTYVSSGASIMTAFNCVFQDCEWIDATSGDTPASPYYVGLSSPTGATWQGKNTFPSNGKIRVYSATEPARQDFAQSTRTPFASLYLTEDYEYGNYPGRVVMMSAAAPSSGTWTRGDRVFNSNPSAGGAPGWVCTTGGTPGTWKAMANLAA